MGMDDQQRLRHGQAVALQYALQVLLNVGRRPDLVRGVLSDTQLAAEGAVHSAVLGSGYAARILSPFVVEVALKALTAQRVGRRAAPTHDLVELYDGLHDDQSPISAQSELDREFERIKMSEIPDETRSLREVLEAHGDNFVRWRYLDDPVGLEGQADLLQYVACAVLNVYNTASG